MLVACHGAVDLFLAEVLSKRSVDAEVLEDEQLVGFVLYFCKGGNKNWLGSKLAN